MNACSAVAERRVNAERRADAERRVDAERIDRCAVTQRVLVSALLGVALACSTRDDVEDARNGGPDGGSERSDGSGTTSGIETGEASDEPTLSDAEPPNRVDAGADAGVAPEAGGSPTDPGGSDVPPDAGPPSGEDAGDAGVVDESSLAFVPSGLRNTEVSGEGEGLTLIAFTLTRGATGLELYAAARNDGETPACSPGMLTYFYDRDEQQVAAVGNVLHNGRLYRLSDGSGVILDCVAPGQVAMLGSTGLPGHIALEEIAYLEHTFPAFTVDVVPIEPFAAEDVRVVPSDVGNVYTGTFTNVLDVVVTNPNVVVFPVNRAGRPLGMASSSAPIEIPPGGTWSFETSAVPDVGVDYVLYPAASLSVE